MEKTVRNQNLKFSVEYPDDDREGRGPTNYEVVKRRKVDVETEQDGNSEEAYQTETSLKEDETTVKGEFEWTIDEVPQNEEQQAKSNESDSSKREANKYEENNTISRKDEFIRTTAVSERKSNDKQGNNRYDNIKSRHVQNTRNNKVLTEKKPEVQAVTEPKPKQQQPDIRANDVGERLYSKRKIWRSDQIRQGMLQV